MPIVARWRKLTAMPRPRGRDAMPGVYELADESKGVIYIGQSAKDVPNRIRQHLKRSTCIAEKAVYWRYAYSRLPQSDEAELIKTHIERHSRIPTCNKARPLIRDLLRRYSERSGNVN